MQDRNRSRLGFTAFILMTLFQQNGLALPLPPNNAPPNEEKRLKKEEKMERALKYSETRFLQSKQMVGKELRLKEKPTREQNSFASRNKR